MKRVLCLIVTLLVLSPAALAQSAAAFDPFDEAAIKAGKEWAQFANKSPTMVDVERIGIVPLVPDQAGTVTAAQAAQVTQYLMDSFEGTRFKVIAKPDTLAQITVPQVIAEIRIDDLITPDTRSELQVKGVQALVFGWVTKAEASDLKGRVQISARMIKISGGDVLAKSVAAEVDRTSHRQQFMMIALGIIVVALVLMVLARIFKGLADARAARLGTDRQIQAGKAVRSKAVDEIKRLRDVLGRVQLAARSEGNADLAGRIKEVSITADELASTIKNAPTGNEQAFKDGSAPRSELDKLIALDTMIDGLLDEVTKEALRLEEAGTQDRDARLATLRGLLNQLGTRFSERSDFLKRTGS